MIQMHGAWVLNSEALTTVPVPHSRIGTSTHIPPCSLSPLLPAGFHPYRSPWRKWAIGTFVFSAIFSVIFSVLCYSSYHVSRVCICL